MQSTIETPKLAVPTRKEFNKVLEYLISKGLGNERIGSVYDYLMCYTEIEREMGDEQ